MVCSQKTKTESRGNIVTNSTKSLKMIHIQKGKKNLNTKPTESTRSIPCSNEVNLGGSRMQASGQNTSQGEQLGICSTSLPQSLERGKGLVMHSLINT